MEVLIRKKYIISQYASKSLLFDYVSVPHKSFCENYAKVILEKILKGIKYSQENGICNRDIKLENIR